MDVLFPFAEYWWPLCLGPVRSRSRCPEPGDPAVPADHADHATTAWPAFRRAPGRPHATPLIVFTSNVFAILGLRAMYFMLAGAIDRFYLLKYALAFILIFVGLKMVWLNDAFGGKFPIVWSLGIIGGLLLAAVVASLVRRPVRE